MMSYFCTKILTLLFIISVVNLRTATSVEGNCNTADVNNGKCVKAEECPRIKKILQSGFISADEVKYIKRNKCDSVLVCCANEEVPIIKTKPKGSRLNLLPSLSDCGITFGDRITNGDLTGIDEYGFHARLAYENTKTSEIRYRCGGSLINKRYVLTASHCVTPLPKFTKIDHIRLGEWFTETNPDCKIISGERFCTDPVVDIPIETILPHGMFSKDFNGENDIALIRLAKEVQYTEYIRPICLPITDKMKKADFTGKKLVAVGYGNVGKFSSSQFKLKVSLPFVPMSECEKRLPRPILKSSHICAGGADGKDTCQGDSGGPLFNLAEDAYILRGITSAGGTCGGDRPAIYTKVALFVDWILDNLEP